jgi:S-adenosylmethionine uptake transporter
MWLATLGGFIGILFVLQPNAHTFNKGSLFFLVAAMLFGMLDILNKKYVTKEPMLCMLFYSTAVALFLVIFPAMQVWRAPTSYELIWLLILGFGSNLILYCILRAFSLTNTTSLAPFRYIELLISMTVGYVFFRELPTSYSYLGAAIIIPCTLFIGYYQARKRS